ncbi:hypothetical protein HC62_09875 [Acetobacter tropicalis]|uniref:Uncharacterized protein n=1 Tax=Acetobacter tropicalis TaxID=104102 RepID=A0A252A7Y5_9PROT|nr:hypothetical protein HC62_09875 [Acetobacter tropicalis]
MFSGPYVLKPDYAWIGPALIFAHPAGKGEGVKTCFLVTFWREGSKESRISAIKAGWQVNKVKEADALLAKELLVCAVGGCLLVSRSKGAFC